MKTKWPPPKKHEGWHDRGYAPAFRRLDPNLIDLSKPPIVHPRGKEGGWGK